MDQEIIRQIVSRIIRQMAAYSITSVNPRPIPVGVSNRHAHLSQSDARKRLIHMQPSDAVFFGVVDGQEVQVRVGGERGIIFEHVTVRINSMSSLEFQIDMDEANAAGVRHGDMTACLITVYHAQGVGPVPAGSVSAGAVSVGPGTNEGAVPDEEAGSLVTEETVRKAWKKNTGLIINKGAICTPLAKDAIKELGVRVIWK